MLPRACGGPFLALRHCGPANWSSPNPYILPPAHRRCLWAPFSLPITHWLIISYLTFVDHQTKPPWAEPWCWLPVVPRVWAQGSRENVAPLLTPPLPHTKKTLCSSTLFTKMYFCDTPKYRHLSRTQVVKQCNVSSAQGAGSGHLGMEGRASWGPSRPSAELGMQGSCPIPGLGGKDSRRKRPGASPLGCSSQRC